MTEVEVIACLTEVRLQRGLTLRDVAACTTGHRMSTTTSRQAVHLSHGVLWMYEHGDRRPTVTALNAWARALGYELVMELRERDEPVLEAPA